MKMIYGIVGLCKGYANDKSEDELKELWLKEHLELLFPFVTIAVEPSEDYRVENLVGSITME